MREAHSGETVGMSGVQKVDDYTMTVQLSAWDPTFLGYYCDPGAILPEHVLSGVSFSDWAKTDFAEHPVTYGPYKLVTWEHGEYIKLVKNEAWAGERYSSCFISRWTKSRKKGRVEVLQRALIKTRSFHCWHHMLN